MSMYHNTIREAIGNVSDAVAGEVETIMREDIFHSTLDWQTRAQLHKAALKAHEVYRAEYCEDCGRHMDEHDLRQFTGNTCPKKN